MNDYSKKYEIFGLKENYKNKPDKPGAVANRIKKCTILKSANISYSASTKIDNK